AFFQYWYSQWLLMLIEDTDEPSAGRNLSRGDDERYHGACGGDPARLPTGGQQDDPGTGTLPRIRSLPAYQGTPSPDARRTAFLPRGRAGVSGAGAPARRRCPHP